MYKILFLIIYLYYIDIDLYDPWNCNFISITNCTLKSNNLSLVNPPYPEPSKDYQMESPNSIYEQGFDKQSSPSSPNLKDLRRDYNDAYLHSGSFII